VRVGGSVALVPAPGEITTGLLWDAWMSSLAIADVVRWLSPSAFSQLGH